MSGGYLKYKYTYSAFQKYLVGENFNFRELSHLLIESALTIIDSLLRNIPTPFGMILRRFYYKFRLKSLGKSSIIDVGVYLIGPKNISIGSFTWLDTGVKLEATLGEIQIGSRCHVGSYAVLGSREPIIVSDFVGIASGVHIYSNSETPKAGLHMSGPMVPETMKAFHSKKIHIGKDAVVGTNSVLLPGASLGEGAILGALSLLNKPIPEWEIWLGIPAKKIKSREKI